MRIKCSYYATRFKEYLHSFFLVLGKYCVERTLLCECKHRRNWMCDVYICTLKSKPLSWSALSYHKHSKQVRYHDPSPIHIETLGRKRVKIKVNGKKAPFCRITSASFIILFMSHLRILHSIDSDWLQFISLHIGSNDWMCCLVVYPRCFVKRTFMKRWKEAYVGRHAATARVTKYLFVETSQVLLFM